MALIVEGTTSKDITVARPKATVQTVKTSPTTSIQKVVVAPSTTPTPIATVSKSSGGVGSTSITPTTAVKSSGSTSKKKAPTTAQIQAGVAENQAKAQAEAQRKAAQEELANQVNTLKEAQSAQLGVFGKETQKVAEAVRSAIQDTGKQASSEMIVKGIQDITNIKGESQVDLTALITGQKQPETPEEQATFSAVQEYLTGLSQMPEEEQAPAELPEVGATQTNRTGGYSAQQPAQEYGIEGAGETGLVPYGSGDMSQSLADPVGSFMSDNPYWEQLASMKFEYDPMKDPEYINGSAILENQISQMMVGRGGLYSSVQQAALSTKLIEFQVALRKQAFEQYTADRNFMMNMAKTVWERQAQIFSQTMQMKNYDLNVAQMQFDQKMSLAKFNADREDAMFSRQMQQASLNLQRENQRLAQAKMMADAQNEAMASQLNSDIANVSIQQSTYERLLDKWKNQEANTTADIVAFFGLPSYTVRYSQAGNYIAKKQSAIETQTKYVMQNAADLGQLDIIQAMLSQYVNEPVTYDVSKTVGDSGTSTTYKYTTTEMPR